MSFSILQTGSSLQFMDDDGALTSLTLPAGVTLSQDVAPQWAIFGNYILLVNTPSTPLTIDSTGTVRPLTPKPPSSAPVVAAGTSGALSGTYGGIRYTFLIKDVNGNVIAESAMSPASNTVTITSQNLQVSGVETSTEPISARRLYRPTTNGSTLFPWFDIDGNTITTAQDDLSDAGLSLVAAPTLGNPPKLTLIKEWRGLLWGVGDEAIDDLLFSAAGAFYSWPTTNSITISGAGRDRFGIKSLMPRREALGVGRRDQIWQITGTTSDDFRAVKLSEFTGIESAATVAAYRDTVWWLWKDGVYQWDGEGIKNIADGKVRRWFTSDYFNPDLFQNAFAVFDPVRTKYRLFLASAGSFTIDSWIEYDVMAKTWWGPHSTTAFTPTSAFLHSDGEDVLTAVMGSATHVWAEQATPTDSAHTAIPLTFTTTFFDAEFANYEKVWGELQVVGKPQTVDVTQYKRLVLADGPAGYWRLGDSVGSVTAADTSGHAHPGTVIGGVTFGQATPQPDGDTAAALNGTTGYISVPQASGITPTGDFTVECWIQSATTTAQVPLIDKFGGGGPFDGFLFNVNGDGVNAGKLTLWTGAGWVHGTARVDDNLRHHVAAVLSGSTVTFYIDGVLDAARAASGAVTLNNTHALEIGRRYDSLAFAAITIDEVAIYLSALTGAQLAGHYMAGLALNPATGILTITPVVGYTNTPASTPLSYDMTKGRQRLPRLGQGKLLQLTFSHSVAGDGVELYGIDIPYKVRGKR